MKRGTLCWVNLEPVTPPEFGKTRPALVVSNSDQNVFLKSIVVVPISSRHGEIWPLRLRIELPRGKASFAVIPGIRRVSKDRVTEIIGMAASGDLDRITEALFGYLND